MFFALILAVVSFVAWFLSMLGGGGSPLVLIPLISFLYGAQAVAPVITIGMLIGSVQRSLFFWDDIDWQVTRWQIPGSLIGSVLGIYVFTKIHLEWLQAIVGVGLLFMVLYEWVAKKEQAFQMSAWQFLPLSILNSFGSALIGSTGPVLNPFYLNYGLVKENMIATKSLNVALMHGIKIVIYMALGILSWDYFFYGLVIGLAAIPANLLGKIVLEKMSNAQFRQVIFAFVAVSGVLMLWEQRNFLVFVG